MRVVVIDHDPETGPRVAEILEPLKAEVSCAPDADAGIALARREAPDLILVDFETPGMDGLEVLERLRLIPQLEHTPVLFATGGDSKQVLTACFHARASDYVRKPYCADELRARVRAMLDRRQLVGRLQQLSLNDELTGLPNRASLRDSVQVAIDAGGQSKDHSFAVLYLEFDRFRLINNSLGNDVGESLVEEIARRIKASVRANDDVGHTPIAARLGGDEFVILLQGLQVRKDAVQVAERLLDVFAEPFHVGGHEVCSTASIGLAVADESYATADELLRDADMAMCAAKAAGKSQFKEFDASMRERGEGRLRLESELRTALAVGQFTLEYLPIISLDTGCAHGVEALVRWEHPQHGVISREDFIPAAEEIGMILDLDEWLTHEALGQFARWRKTLRFAAPETIHINVSRQSLSSGTLFDLVVRALELHDVAPGDLHLEVCESEIMHDPEAATQALSALRRLGVKVDLDHFGTGYSSLTCLHEFPLDGVKIDRSFVSNSDRGRDFAALLHAVTTLARNLGLEVVAEGVEEPGQLAMLQALSCDYGQGQLFSEPLSAEATGQFLVLLREQARAG